jgi:hypothetical protein
VHSAQRVLAFTGLVDAPDLLTRLARTCALRRAAERLIAEQARPRHWPTGAPRRCCRC